MSRQAARHSIRMRECCSLLVLLTNTSLEEFGHPLSFVVSTVFSHTSPQSRFSADCLFSRREFILLAVDSLPWHRHVICTAFCMWMWLSIIWSCHVSTVHNHCDHSMCRE